MSEFDMGWVIAELGFGLIVNKPGGVLTQAPPGIDSLEFRIRQYFQQQSDNKAGKIYLGVPHRLDRPVSGAMVFARNVRAAKRIAEQFQLRLVAKVYWAVVEGIVETPSGRWTDSMKKIPDQAKSVIASDDDPLAQKAVLDYEVLESNGHQSWLRIMLQTGRTHQIRLQASRRGHPVVGDELYGSGTQFGPRVADTRQRWIALHSRELGFQNPVTGAEQHFTADLWDYWNELEFELPGPYVQA